MGTIEINGRRYDALTGRLLRVSPEKPKTRHEPAAAGKSLDGFTYRPNSAVHKAAARKINETVRHKATPAYQVHKKTQRTQTLMRAAAKKPVVKKIEKHGEDSAAQKLVTAQHTVNAGRISRAGHIKKSRLISKFGTNDPRSTQAIAVPLPVRPAPSKIPTLPLNSFSRQAHEIAIPAGQGHFEAALTSAVSHKQPKPKKHNKIHHRVARKLHVGPRAVSVTASLTAVLLIAGFIAYQNVPNIAMRIATTRAGVHGKLPGYTPAGFSISGPIEYRSGQISVNFKSNTDERQFKVVQESSDWNSDTLLTSLTSSGRQPVSVQKQGKTIFIYDNDNAAWVSGGTKYRIESNADLNSDQLLRLAAGL